MLFYMRKAFFFFNCKTNKVITRIIGNTITTSNPIFRLSPTSEETFPTIVGESIPPISPAKARNANIAVPPLGHFLEEILNDPGHIIPTDNPHNAHPTKPKIGIDDNETNNYIKPSDTKNVRRFVIF